MNKRLLATSLIAGALTLLSAPAAAQQPDLAAELQAMRARIAELEAKVLKLEAERAGTEAPAPIPAPPTASSAPALPPQVDTPSPAATAAAETSITWRGAPQFREEKAGFAFKLRGFAQFDTGFVENPRGAILTQNLGFATRARRLVLGAEGSLPGGFGYKAELNFGNGNLGYEDVILTYARPGSPLSVTVGNFFPLAGLEATTSSRLGSVLEREQASDAFGLERRIGLALRYADPGDLFLAEAGIFNATIDSGFDNDSRQASVRALLTPRLGDRGRLHLGLNLQHRRTPSGAQNLRYRSRPYSQLTDLRFVDTFPIAARGDDILGLELAAILGPFHIAAEGHRSWVNGYRPGTVLVPPDSVSSGLPYAADPVFQTGYAEIGLYLTGETRGYRGGRWDNVRVLRPLGRGGWGALQVNARIDRTDLTDRVGPTFAYPDFIDGGIQTGYQLSAIWNPTDYVRLLLLYSRIEVDGGPFALTVLPGITDPARERAYGVDSLALRTQIEF